MREQFLICIIHPNPLNYCMSAPSVDSETRDDEEFTSKRTRKKLSEFNLFILLRHDNLERISFVNDERFREIRICCTF